MTRECFAAYLSLEIISCVVSTSTCCGSITAGWDEHLYGDEGLIDGLRSAVLRQLPGHHWPVRREKSSVAPSPHMTAADACRVLVMNKGRPASAALALTAQ